MDDGITMYQGIFCLFVGLLYWGKIISGVVKDNWDLDASINSRNRDFI